MYALHDGHKYFLIMQYCQNEFVFFHRFGHQRVAVVLPDALEQFSLKTGQTSLP